MTLLRSIADVDVIADSIMVATIVRAPFRIDERQTPILRHVRCSRPPKGRIVELYKTLVIPLPVYELWLDVAGLRVLCDAIHLCPLVLARKDLEVCAVQGDQVDVATAVRNQTQPSGTSETFAKVPVATLARVPMANRIPTVLGVQLGIRTLEEPNILSSMISSRHHEKEIAGASLTKPAADAPSSVAQYVMGLLKSSTSSAAAPGGT